MADIRSKLNTIYSLEQLAGGNTVIHRLHPLTKLAVTVTYLLCVISLERHALSRLAPFLFYPILVMALGEIPVGMIFRRCLVALPFCLFAGVSNLILEREVVGNLGNIPFTAGTLSLAVLLVRTLLCVGAVLILVAVTPFHRLTEELRRLHVPALFVALLEMVYRYLGVLMEEGSSMLTALRLRGAGAKWPSASQFGPFVGQLLLRSADRADRVRHAMACRCYVLKTRPKAPVRFNAADGIFLLLGLGTPLVFRCFDLISLFGGLMLW